MPRAAGRYISRPRYREDSPRRFAIGWGGQAGKNLWNTTNIAANLGATVDDKGVTISFSAPNQVYFGWDGPSAAGKTHRLFMETVTAGEFRIVGRVNTANELVAAANLASAQSIVINVPTAGGETGWSLESVSGITPGRIECQVFEE